jgi:hypothetical protein
MTGFRLRLNGRVVVIAATVLMIPTVLWGLQYRASVADEDNLKTSLFQMREAIDQYQADRRECPPSLQALVNAGYLREIPRDPMTGLQTTWRFLRRANTCDVKSGAPQVARNGTSYRNW